MAMQAESLEILEKANVPPATARAFVQAIETQMHAARDALATKHDLAELAGRMERGQGALEVKIAECKAELVRWVFIVMLGNVALSATATALLNAPCLTG